MKVGDLIRNKNPYSGEPCRLIIYIDRDEFHTIDGPGRASYFNYPLHKTIHLKGDLTFYRRANILEVLFLTIYGWKNIKAERTYKNG